MHPWLFKAKLANSLLVLCSNLRVFKLMCIHLTQNWPFSIQVSLPAKLKSNSQTHALIATHRQREVHLWVVSAWSLITKDFLWFIILMLLTRSHSSPSASLYQLIRAVLLCCHDLCQPLRCSALCFSQPLFQCVCVTLCHMDNFNQTQSKDRLHPDFMGQFAL